MKRLLLALTVNLFVLGGANAAIVYQIAGAGTGTDPDTWSATTTWSDAQSGTTDTNPNAALNDYYAGRDENLVLKPVLTDTANPRLRPVNGTTFGGKSLHVSDPNVFSLRSNAGPVGSTVTVPNMFLTSGTITQHASNGVGFINGNITLGLAASRNNFNANGGNRALIFNAKLTGECALLNLGLGSNNTDKVVLYNTANDFKVTTLTQSRGVFEIRGGAGGQIRNLNTTGILRPTSATLLMPLTNVHLTSSVAVLDLTQDMTVARFKVTNGTVTGQELAVGVYPAATLAGTYPGQFTGTGSLTVAGPPLNAIRDWNIY